MSLLRRDTAGSKMFFWIGWTLTAIPVLMMGVMSTFMLFFKIDLVYENLRQGGFPRHLAVPLMTIEILSVIIYVIPQTAVLGAILLTGYLGGAVATHVRLDEPKWPIAVAIGVIVWLGLYFRDARVRTLIPFRK